MRRYILLGIALTFLVLPAAGEVQYNGVMDSEEVRMNTSILMECDDRCPISQWSLTWNLPDNAEIIEIRDGYGEIDNYERTGDRVSITTNSGEPRRNETIKITTRIDEDADHVYDGLYFRRMSLPGFRDEKTTGVFKVDNLVSGWIGYGFETAFSDEEFRFRGEGPTNIRVGLGEGVEREFYEFFGDERDNSSEAYRLSVGTTGLVQDFDRFPVAVMPEDVYNQSRPSWSSGEYIAGEITLRQNEEKDSYLPVLTHETVHGLNDRFLRWDQTRSSYIEEGVAEHAEYLMRKKLYRNDRSDTGTRQLFGEEEKFRVREDGETYIYTLGSNGDRELLWQYYRQDMDFMKEWSPFDSSSEFREFGYAYSELLVKNYVVNNGSVRDLYSKIDPERKIESPEEKWNYLSQRMDMKPCNYESRERFDRCLDDINSYDYPVYTASSIEREDKELQFDELKLPNRTRESKRGRFTGGEVGFMDFIQGFLEYLFSLFQ